jgi:hypothetical protein
VLPLRLEQERFPETSGEIARRFVQEPDDLFIS